MEARKRVWKVNSKQPNAGKVDVQQVKNEDDDDSDGWSKLNQIDDIERHGDTSYNHC